MKTVAVFLTDGFEMVEALTPVDYMRRAGLSVTTVCVPSITLKDEKIAVSSHKVPVICDMSFEEYIDAFSENPPDAVICPGGSVGSENLSNFVDLTEHLEKCNKMGKLVCAICAAPAVVLGKTDVLIGKKWTCYPGMNDRAAPNVLKNSTYTASRVEVSENVLTACGAGASEEFAMTIIKLLAGKAESERVAKATCQR